MDDGPSSVDILLATYNGARFVEAQIDSLLQQTVPGIRLLVHDDGSSDATPAILRRFATQSPERILLIDGGRTNLGASGSFSFLLEHASADYVMFSDQDDVWQGSKVDATLGRMRQIERAGGADCPILVHTDMAVVDEHLRMLSPSFWAYQRLDPQRGASLDRLLVQNVVTGCASMINRALLRKAAPIPPGVMHDGWLALVAAVFGRLECLRQSTMLYRQHGDNQVGAQAWSMVRIVRRALSLFGKAPRSLRNVQHQASEFVGRFERELASDQRRMLHAHAHISRPKFLVRRLRLLQRRLPAQ